MTNLSHPLLWWEILNCDVKNSLQLTSQWWRFRLRHSMKDLRRLCPWPRCINSAQRMTRKSEKKKAFSSRSGATFSRSRFWRSQRFFDPNKPHKRKKNESFMPINMLFYAVFNGDRKTKKKLAELIKCATSVGCFAPKSVMCWSLMGLLTFHHNYLQHCHKTHLLSYSR